MPDLKQISDDADMIVCGFAYKKTDEGIRVFDLNNGKGAAVISSDGTLIETNMDDIEFSIAQKYYISNAKDMEGYRCQGIILLRFEVIFFIFYFCG